MQLVPDNRSCHLIEEPRLLRDARHDFTSALCIQRAAVLQKRQAREEKYKEQEAQRQGEAAVIAAELAAAEAAHRQAEQKLESSLAEVESVKVCAKPSTAAQDGMLTCFPRA
jgi:hypothetical protein